MRLAARASLAVGVSAALVLVLGFLLPPLVIDKRSVFGGRDRGEAEAVADRLAAAVAAGGDGPALVAEYGARYPYMDFELLGTDLRVEASSRPGKAEYALGDIIRRVDERRNPGDELSSFREVGPAGGRGYLLTRLRDPFYIGLSDRAVRFLSRAFAYALLLSVGIFALVLAAFSLPFARRVSALSRRISAFAPGDGALPERGRDETAVVAASFNAMASRLAAAEAAAAARNAEWRASVANLSHDLRTPLASILGYSESLVALAYDGEEERRRYELVIHAKARYMSRVLADLLELARLEDRPGPSELAVLDLAELCRSAAIEYLDEAQSAGAEIVADIPDSPIEMEADREALSRALRNLLDNALRYAASGGSIELSARLEGALATIALRDFGPGIPPEEAARVFDRYYRPARRPGAGSDDGGLGLGLPIARAAARRHGGDLVLELPTGGGCRFVMTLPARAGSAGGGKGGDGERRRDKL